MKTLLISSILLIPVVVHADEKVKPIDVVKLDRKDPIAYEKDVEPIFRAKCVACHSGKELKGKFDVGNYATVMKGGAHGPVLVPNKSADSRIVLHVGKT